MAIAAPRVPSQPAATYARQFRSNGAPASAVIGFDDGARGPWVGGARGRQIAAVGPDAFVIAISGHASLHGPFNIEIDALRVSTQPLR